MKQDPLDFHLTINKKQFILKIVLDCHMKFIALTIILMLTAGIAGFTIGNVKNKNLSLPQLTQNTSQSKESPSLFDTQTATITGSVTSILDTTLTITDTKNQSAQFAASDKMIVLSLDSKPNFASPSSGLKSVELNKPALIQLQMENGLYKIISIGYLPTNVPPPPAPAPATN